MEKLFKQLRGKRVFLETPKVPDASKVILSEKDQMEYVEKEKLKMNRFRVYAVGSDVSDGIEEGDEVCVDMQALQTRATVQRLTDDVSVIVLF